MKRAFDVVVAGIGLTALAPLIGALALLIKLDSPGPALFRQTRVGRRRRAIETVKLRTMVNGSAGRGLQITAHHDVRITRVGRWLRKSKLDELPQLWNVLRGDMSLVGPRPEVPRYVSIYKPEWEPLLDVRPGLTDLGSLVFRDEEQLLAVARDQDRAYREVIMPMKLRLALEGVSRSSLAYDLQTIALTFVAIVRGAALGQESTIEEARRRIERLNESAP